MKTATTGMAIGLAVLLAAGCNNGQDAGEPVALQFGDAVVDISLRNVQVQTLADGTQSITAEMVSELPDIYTVEVALQGPDAFHVRLAGGEISHTIDLTASGMNIEFLRPTWERAETVSFADAATMNEWLAGQAESCAGMPVRFQDLPLQYASEAILSHLATSRNLQIDVTRVQSVLCTRAASDPEGSAVVHPRGIDGWNALRDGNYLPAELPVELTAATNTEKNDCARSTAAVSVAAGYDTSAQGNIATNLSMSCTDAVLDVNANCCVDEGLGANSAAYLRKMSYATHPYCRNVYNSTGGTTSMVMFTFTGQAKACPTLGDSCWPNGVRDTATSFACDLGNYNDATGQLVNHFGGSTLRESGVAANAYTNVRTINCVQVGTDGTDTVYSQMNTVDNLRPNAMICRDGNENSCYCSLL